ncbi:MAG: GNAT family N-acetyltransferase [Terriglobia bacterium]
MATTPLTPDLAALILRPARLRDAPAFAGLTTQLGYPSSPSQVEERMTTVLGDPEHHVLAAVWGGHVVGWAHAYICCLIESDSFVELGGLVVDESHRGKGVGGKLLEMMEDWARQKGGRTISVRSNVIRHEAHKFYAAHGYDQIKTQHAFRKRL